MFSTNVNDGFIFSSFSVVPRNAQTHFYPKKQSNCESRNAQAHFYSKKQSNCESRNAQTHYYTKKQSNCEFKLISNNICGELTPRGSIKIVSFLNYNT